jgi:hypothetical protein
MKQLLRFTIIALLVAISALRAVAQPINLPPGVTLRYFTSFENPNPFILTTPVGNPGFTVETSLSFPTNAGQSVRGRMGVGQSSTLTTSTFSTLGQFKVWLDFAHIAKIEQIDSAVIQYSLDNGATWTNLTGQTCRYFGASSYFRTANKFTQQAYPVEWQLANTGAIPQNNATWWKNERFDISLAVGNQPNVMLRFYMSDRNNNAMGSPSAAYGWLLDSILVTSAFSELIPPLITHTPITGLQFNIAQTITATVRDSFGCDSTGIADVWLFYKRNSGSLDSLVMNRTGTTLNWTRALDTSRVADGDTVRYFIRAKDSSPSGNIKYFPNQVNPGDSFITYLASFFPTIGSHTAIQGQQFSPGPFAITANFTDASGIDSAILNYRINQGPWIKTRMLSVGSNNFRDTIRTIDGDTVRYYLEAVDNSPRRFRAFLPNRNLSPDTSWLFIASGPPDVTWPQSSNQCDVFLGSIFSYGPFTIGLRALDGSGIDTAILFYKVNQGPWLQAGMTRNTVANAYCNWQGTISPTVTNLDTVFYYARVQDASVRNNFTISPSATSPRFFITLGPTTLPYADNFDVSDLWTGYIASGSVTNPALTLGGWNRGTPAKSIINSARSTPNAWVTGALNADYPANSWYVLESPVFTFAQAQNMILSFWQRREIGAGDGFWIEYTTNPNSVPPTWTKLGNSSATDTNQTNWYSVANVSGLTGANGGAWAGSSNGWVRSERRLSESNLQGTNRPIPDDKVKFRFVFRSNATAQANGVAIDDISITFPPLVDLAVTSIASNSANLPVSIANNNFQRIAGDNLVLYSRFRNFGRSVIDTIIPIVVELGAYRDTTYINTRINSNAFGPSFTTAFRLDTIPSVPEGWFTVRIYSLFPNDENLTNDTLSVQIYGVPLRTVGYLDNFDGPVDEWMTIPVGTSPIVWERGVPTGAQLNSAFTAPNVWATNLSGTPAANAVAYLYSPIIRFNNIVNSTVRFRMNKRLTGSGAIRLSWADTLSNTWQILGGIADGASPNQTWYSSSISIGTVSGAAWTQSLADTGYITHMLRLPTSFNYRAGRGVRFRFEFRSGTAEGVVIDNFEILPPPPVELELIGLTAPGIGNCLPVVSGDSLRAVDTVSVLVRNNGGDTLRSIPFNISLSSGTTVGPLLWPTDYIHLDTIAPNQTKLIRLLRGFNSPAPGCYTLRAFHRLPTDTVRRNDTASRSVRAIPALDLMVVDILEPASSICHPAGPTRVRVVVRNIGHTASGSFNLGYRLASGATQTQSLTRTIQPKGFDTITLSTPINVLLGPDTLRVFVRNVSDPVPNNDTLTRLLVGSPPIRLIHTNNFDGFNALGQYCLAPSSIGLATPIPSVAGGSGKSLILEGSGGTWDAAIPLPSLGGVWRSTFNPDRLRQVAMPISSTVNDTNLHIRFRLQQILRASGTSGAGNVYLRILVNGQQVYNAPSRTTAGTFQSLENVSLKGFYTPGEPFLLEIQGKSNFSYSTNTSLRANANIIDELFVYHRHAQGAEVMEVTYNKPFPSATDTVLASARIRNNGDNTLNTVNARLTLNGLPVPGASLSLSNLNLGFMADTVYQFQSPFFLNEGSNTICVDVDQPNGTADQYPFNDTACTEAIGFPVISSFPYCNNFDGALPEWLTRNWSTLRSGGNSWTKGTPTKGFMNGAASGSNCWYIDADSTYSPYDSSALFTPIFSVQQGSCYRVSFKTKFLTDFWANNITNAPLHGDGGTIEYSTNGGIRFLNWGEIDTVTFNWYNNVVHSLKDYTVSPSNAGFGWSGQSDSAWMDMSHIFNTINTGRVIFRFKFASDDAFQGEGFAIDDFCFEEVSAPCDLVSVEELTSGGFVLHPNYPNPFSGTTRIRYELSEGARTQLLIQDLSGRVLWQGQTERREAGLHEEDVQLGHLQSGIYLYTLRVDGVSKTRKMILTR